MADLVLVAVLQCFMAASIVSTTIRSPDMQDLRRLSNNPGDSENVWASSQAFPLGALSNVFMLDSPSCEETCESADSTPAISPSPAGAVEPRTTMSGESGERSNTVGGIGLSSRVESLFC